MTNLVQNTSLHTPHSIFIDRISYKIYVLMWCRYNELFKSIDSGGYARDEYRNIWELINNLKLSILK